MGGIGWKLRFGTSRLCIVILCTWFSWTPRLLTLIEVKGNRVVAALPLHLVSVSGRLDWLDRKPHSPDTKILQLVVQYFLLNSYCETGKCDSLLNVTFFKLKKGCQLTENWRIMWQSLNVTLLICVSGSVFNHCNKTSKFCSLWSCACCDLCHPCKWLRFHLVFHCETAAAHSLPTLSRMRALFDSFEVAAKSLNPTFNVI